MNPFTLICLSVVFQIKHVVALPSFLDPQRGSTPQEEMQCYSLPYGTLGFISHMITCYTLYCLWRRVRPLWPTKKMNSWKWDLILGICALIIPVAFAIFTIVRCRNGWQYLTIGIWKMFVSAMLGSSAISAALSTRPVNGVIPPTYNGKRQNYSPAWVLLYLPGLITGLTGLFSLVKENWHIHEVQLTTYLMWGWLGSFMLLGGSYGIFKFSSMNKEGFIRKMLCAFTALVCGTGLTLGVVGALYSDWILSAIGGNYLGVPSGDNVWLYWGYFIAKKLPLGSM